MRLVKRVTKRWPFFYAGRWMNKTNFILALLFALLLPHSESTAQKAITTPDLIVIISVDQLPSEYLVRFRPYFSAEGAFLRFLNEGTSYTHSRYSHATTKTGPGHATIGSGLPPSRTGIVSNDWYDRDRKTGVYCAEDARSALTAGNGKRVSPINLAEDGLGDRVRQKYPTSVIIGISDKDRSAILMAGKRANAAYWLDESILSFVSSDYYQYDSKVLAFTERLPSYLAAHREWIESGLIPPAAIGRVTFDPLELRKYKTDNYRTGVSFPHPIASIEALTHTPFGDEMILDFARYTITTSKMGSRDGSPDILFVGLSSTDAIGHNHGPQSREIADTIVRLDRTLGNFLRWLDTREGTVVVALTSDHGVQAIPEIARAQGKMAGRLSFARAMIAATIGESTPLRRDLELSVAKRLGIKLSVSSPIAEALIESVDPPDFYLNWERLKLAKIDPARARNVLAEELRKIAGVSEVFTSSQLLSVNRAAGRVELAARSSFRADRSGDVVAFYKENYISSGALTGTNHGQPVDADQLVPLLFWGEGIAARKPQEAGSPLDLATTLGSMVGVKVGEPDRKPLQVFHSN